MDQASTSEVQPLAAEYAAIVEALPMLTVTPDSLGPMRELMAAVLPPTPPADDVVRTDHVVDEATGVSVRVHQPVGTPAESTSGRPCVYSIHGGGYVLGNVDMDDLMLAEWCRRLGIVGVSVEYRLAPEHPYPTPLEDCYAGLRWVHDRADDLGVDRSRIGLNGASAGGGLAAALAIVARDRGEVPLRCQLLDSPMLDDRQLTPSSQLDGLAIWSRDSNTFGWRSYLGELYGTADVSAWAAPARATDLRGLPAAFVCVGTVDGFRDEDIAYATRLNQAGVPTELHVYPGAPHGFQMVPDAPASVQSTAAKLQWLARQLGETVS